MIKIQKHHLIKYKTSLEHHLNRPKLRISTLSVWSVPKHRKHNALNFEFD